MDCQRVQPAGKKFKRELGKQTFQCSQSYRRKKDFPKWILRTIIQEHHEKSKDPILITILRRPPLTGSLCSLWKPNADPAGKKHPCGACPSGQYTKGSPSLIKGKMNGLE